MKKGGSGNTALVYSSEWGRVCPDCGKPVKECICRKKSGAPVGDGAVRVRRETKGRGGKTVIVVTGLPLDAAALTALGAELKKSCGCGGTVKDGAIEIQGDHAEKIMQELTKKGYKPKRSGG